MQAQYPMYVPHPSLGGKLRRVETQEDHQRMNPVHYAEFQEALVDDRGKFTAGVTAEVERERCAAIAENYPKAGKLGVDIAKAIRNAAGSAPIAAPPLQLSEYPKTMRNPQVEDKQSETHPAARGGGKFGRADVTVIDAEQEALAVAEGYTVVFSKASPVELGPSVR